MVLVVLADFLHWAIRSILDMPPEPLAKVLSQGAREFLPYFLVHEVFQLDFMPHGERLNVLEGTPLGVVEEKSHHCIPFFLLLLEPCLAYRRRPPLLSRLAGQHPFTFLRG